MTAEIDPSTAPQTASPTRLIERFDEISDGYGVLLCDLWGCYHNGVTPYPAAVAALQAYRRRGGRVILLTNAPRPSNAVRSHLASMGAPEDSFDAVISSGDATRAEVASGRFGRRLHLVGPERDAPIWEGLDIEARPLAEAEAVLCTGLFDDMTETPADYADLVREGVARDLPFACANPDVIVDRAERRLYCAGAIAADYAAAGGRVFYFGKPHAPIYRLALDTAEVLAPGVARQAVLAIGDGVDTDVLGAADAGLDCVFVSGGLAAAEVGDDPERPDPTRLTQYLAARNRSPRYTIGRLR